MNSGVVGPILGPVVSEIKITKENDLTTVGREERGEGVGKEGVAGEGGSCVMT